MRKVRTVVYSALGLVVLASTAFGITEMSRQHLTKYLFVIDKSGSNTVTDPMNVKRAGSIEKFFNGLDDNWEKRNESSKYEWGYIAFQGSSAAAYINKDGKEDEPVFVGPRQGAAFAMSNALIAQRTRPDDDATPYHEALSLAKKAISVDLDKRSKSNDYYVIFMSDGMPTDYGQVEAPAGPAATIDVENIVSLSKGHIHLSTAFYGSYSEGAIAGLKLMALHGQGTFVDLNDVPNFKIEDLLNSGFSGGN